MKRNRIVLLALLIGSGYNAFSQQLLTKEQAVKIALENNYDIQIARNNLAVEGNNSSLYNSGYLPQVSGTAGGSYNKSDTEFEFVGGEKRTIDGAETTSYNASVALDYTLFDGMGRKYTYKKLKETYKLSEVQVQQVMENALLSLFNSYYEVARLTENLENQKQTLEVSQKRLKRAKYNYSYGQGTQLDVLNSEVDVNNDSVTYLNTRQLLANSIRDLNVILGQDVHSTFDVETNVIYTDGLVLESTLEQAKEKNVAILQANKNIELSEFDIKISQAGWMPRITTRSTYGWSASENGASANQITTQSNIGLNTGLTLSWNIFDGGTTKVRVQNAKISRENQNIAKLQAEQQLERDVANQWEIYQNALFVMEARNKAVQTNALNFERSQEQYNLGQITSIEFRQAQVNYLNASTSYNQSKFEAKIAELKLLQLKGELIGAQY